MPLGDNMTSPMYGVSAGGGLSELGEYDPKITEEIDRQIRNLPMVVEHCYKKAVELLNATGSNNFEIVLSTEHGAEVSHQQTDAMGRRKYMTRKLVWDEGSRQWGQDVGTSSQGHERQRPRAYVAPANGKGIHEELSQAVLLKAAMGMTGK